MNYQGKKFLSLPEQVEVNRREIKRLLDEKFVIFTTDLAIQNLTFLTLNELTTVFRKPIVGDLIYGGDFYYSQITRVGGNVVEFKTIGPIADEDAIRGPKGDKGDKGDQGNTGPQGPQGIPGEVQFSDMPGYNLAMPNLTNKEHLGDGWYMLYENGTLTWKYNISTGENWINGTSVSNSFVYNPNVTFNGSHTTSVYDVIGSKTEAIRPNIVVTGSKPHHDGYFNSLPVLRNTIGQTNITMYLGLATYNDFKFKLLIEEGNTATSYTLPGEIPQYNEIFALKQQEAWITPTLLNGATGTLQYRKDSFGRVWFKGNVNVIDSSGHFVLLPKGYRPLQRTELPLIKTNSTFGVTTILTSGAIFASSGEDGFDSITFSTN